MHQKQINRYRFSKKLFIGWVVLCGIVIFDIHQLSAQKVRIDSISSSGLKKTKPYLLTRELTFKKGDSIDLKEVQTIFAQNEQRLLNTNLFVEAKINMKSLNLDKKRANIHIVLKEGLYIYPAPLFEFLDNDFNKWWRNYDRSLKTLSYGIYVKQINLTGNGDELTVYGQAGFTRKVSLDYDFPFLNKKNTIGVGLTAFYSANKEVAYITDGNYLQFKRDFDNDLLRRSKVGIRMVYRPKLFLRHHLLINYYNFNGSDSLTQFYNPEYFNGRSSLSYGEVEYATVYDTRDIVPYAMKGDHLIGYLNKSGLNQNINIFYVGGQGAHYTSFNKRWSMENIIGGRYNIDRDKVPYYFNKALGYDDLYLRGYEYYVIDGQNYGFLKNSLRFMFFDKSFELGRIMLLKAYRTMPVKTFITANLDLGYVNDRYYAVENPFANRTLYGYGVGLDFVFYYNKLLRFEVSRNHTGQTGFYVHFDAGL